MYSPWDIICHLIICSVLPRDYIQIGFALVFRMKKIGKVDGYAGRFSPPEEERCAPAEAVYTETLYSHT